MFWAGETIKRMFIYPGHFRSVYLLLYVSTNLFFAICILALRCSDAGAEHAPSQRSGFSDFLLQTHKRGWILAARIFNPEASLFIKAQACLDHGWKRHVQKPKAAAHCSPACPSYWHLVSLYQLLIRQCSRTGSVQISMQKERSLLPALASKCRNKPRMLDFPYLSWDHIFLVHKNVHTLESHWTPLLCAPHRSSHVSLDQQLDGENKMKLVLLSYLAL